MSKQLQQLSADVWHTYLLLNRFVSAAELRAATGQAEAAIRQHLAILRGQGLIDQEDRGGNTVYRRIPSSSRGVPGDAAAPPVPPPRDAGQAPNRAVTIRAASSDANAVADRSTAEPPAAPPPADRSGKGGSRNRLAAPQVKSLVRRAALPALAAIGLVLIITLVWARWGDQESGTSTSGEGPTVPGADITTPATPGRGDTADTPTGGSDDTQTGDPVDTAAPEAGSLQLDFSSYSGKPFETVPIQGTYAGAEPGTSLRVQRQQDGSWLSFPMRAVSDEDGNFSTYVELGPGRYRLRIADVEKGVVSEEFLLRIG